MSDGDEIIQLLNGADITTTDLYRLQDIVVQKLRVKRKENDTMACKAAVVLEELDATYIEYAIELYKQEYDVGDDKYDDDNLLACLSRAIPDYIPLLFVKSEVSDEVMCCNEWCACKEYGSQYWEGSNYLFALEPEAYYFCDYCKKNGMDYEQELLEIQYREIYLGQFKAALTSSLSQCNKRSKTK